ncbi:hypothetical protein ACFPT7_03705 [Acidicapsa dinghuensis]|uniref:ABC transporter permease n=1 Tax=Acidicapsa dinghuensis TaxID=2218256 RepID=A0ABW1EBM6_9BACT|nr:hypothetical protein [Acidicapsa dinghuensis]
MAGIGSTSDTLSLLNLSSRRHFVAIVWLRWRIFVNAFRRKGATGELVAKILSYPLLAIMVLGPAVGTGFASYYLVNSGQIELLAIPLWIVFLLWQFIGVSTSASGSSFDLTSLIRFPIRYRDYLLMRLLFGLLDPPTLAGVACLIAMSIGIGIATSSLFMFSAAVLFLYCLCNLFFSRMAYAWLERWLAQRRTRELVTGLILLGSLLIQFVSQYFQRLDTRGHHNISPWMATTGKWLVNLNWYLPPGLATAAIDHKHAGDWTVALAASSGLVLFIAGFFFLLHTRLLAQFKGEDLSEAPAAVQKTKRVRKAQSNAVTEKSSNAASLLPPGIAACLKKEFLYLLRSGPKLYVLVMPVFVVLLFSMRTSGVSYFTGTRNNVGDMYFSYGCAYTMLIFVSLLYNSFGSDGAGVQFYFVAPLRIRDAVLAKNLLAVGIFAVEAVALYVAAIAVSHPAPLDLTVATLAWSAFTLFLNMAVGNIRSIVSPKVIDTARVRGQNVSGLNSLISLLVVFATVLVGATVLAICQTLHLSRWIAAAVFLILSVFAAMIYWLALESTDALAARNVESLTSTLGKI